MVGFEPFLWPPSWPIIKSNTILLCNQSLTNTFSSSTRYIRPDGQITASVSTETEAQIRFRTAGVIKNMQLNVPTNSMATNKTVRFRKNSADGNQTVTILAGVTGIYEDNVNTDSVVAGDDVCVQFIGAVGAGSCVIRQVFHLFEASISDTVSRLTVSAGTSTSSANTVYLYLTGNITTSAVELQRQIQQKRVGTMKNLYINVSANARTADFSYTLRANSTNTTITITIGAGLTGIFEDTTNTYAVQIDDKLNYVFINASGVSETHAIQSISIEFVAPNGMGIVSGQNPGGMTFNVTRYSAIKSQDVITSTVEADTQVKSKVPMIFSDMLTFVQSNSITTDPTIIIFRKNGVDGNQSLSIPAGTTGIFHDDTNIDICSAEDLINTRITSPNTSGSINAHGVTMWTFETTEAVVALVQAVTRAFGLVAGLVMRGRGKPIFAS